MEGCQIPICVNRSGLCGAGCPHERKTSGEDEEFFKNQPLFGKFGFLHGGRLMDGIVGPFCRQNAVFLADLLRNDLLGRIANIQCLPYCL